MGIIRRRRMEWKYRRRWNGNKKENIKQRTSGLQSCTAIMNDRMFSISISLLSEEKFVRSERSEMCEMLGEIRND
jgi:hypothetical protein